MFDLTSALTPKEGRDIEAITNDILEAKRRGGEAILTIGRCLTEAKQSLPHGEWLPWLNERVELSERTAQKFMKLAREWSNPNTLADLGASKALMLLALPDSERERFAEDHNVIDMSARQLEQAIRERKEAQEAAARAEAGVLLPCPGCRGEDAKHRAVMACVMIECPCGFMAAGYDLEEARQIWNTRAPILSAEEMEMLDEAT